MPPKNKNSTKAAQPAPGKTPPSWYCRLVVPRNKSKEKQRDLEKTKEIEVQKAYKELQESSSREVPTKLDLLNNHHFKLYCVDFVDHYFDDNFSMKYIEFYGDEVAEPPDPLWFERTEPLDNTQRTKRSGHVYLNAGSGCSLKRFWPPEYYGPGEHLLKTHGGKSKIKICFISKDYLTVTLPRAMVHSPGIEPDPNLTLPEEFKFVGIRYGFEDVKAMLRAMHTKRKRSASP
ncbi:hypothetical protein ACHAPA_007710 [Fusarium lateritium]